MHELFENKANCKEAFICKSPWLRYLGVRGEEEQTYLVVAVRTHQRACPTFDSSTQRDLVAWTPREQFMGTLCR